VDGFSVPFFEKRGEAMAKAQKTQPVHEERLGRVKAVVWQNDTRAGTMFNVQFCRVYHDRENGWQESTSFGRDDCLILARLAEMVSVWIFQNQAKLAQEQETEAA
jgi:hypothetical protein